MKVLSLKLPFEELILEGKKTMELKKWNAKFTGDFLLHSSLKPDEEAMKKFSFDKNSLPLCFILEKANIIDVKKYESEENFKKDLGLHLANSNLGDDSFILNKVSRFDEIIPAKGKTRFLGF